MGRVGRLACLGALGVAVFACRAPEPTEPGQSVALCCKRVEDEGSRFVGCRPQARVCRAAESVWVRGPLTCVGKDEPSCTEGLCCELALSEPEPEQTLEPELGDAAEPEPPSPGSKPAPPASPDEPAVFPRLVAVPKLVCDATIDRELEGTVVLEIEIGTDGQVTRAEIIEGFEPSCDTLARDALLAARFEPAEDAEGRAIPTTLRYEYVFALAD